MISLFTFGCILTSILTNIFYNIKIKQSYNKIFTCLLTLILTYSFFPLFFLITKTIETGSLFIGFTNLTKILTDNIILYSFIGVLRVGIAFLYGYLMANYTLAQITLVLQLGILLYPLSYYLLGNTTSLQSLLGIFVITLGCLISGFKKFTYPNIIKPLLTLPFLLYLFGMIESIIVMCTKLTVFIGSQHTQKTVSIHHFIHNTFTHFPLMHLHWEEPLNFMIGASPFIIVFCILCIIYKENFCLTTITSHIKKDFLTCCYTSASFFTFLCLYFYAFEHTSNKAILMALNQLSIPLTLLFSFIVLKEKILLPQKVATVLIIAGGMIAAF